MRIAIASDHAGFALKEVLRSELASKGYEVDDLGTNDPSRPDDYPDFAAAVGRAITVGGANRAILICGSGVGASVAANKIHGVRAAICHDTYSAHQGVEHDDMNVLVLGSRVIGVALAMELMSTFLKASFTHEERHERRLEKVRQIEAGTFDMAPRIL